MTFQSWWRSNVTDLIFLLQEKAMLLNFGYDDIVINEGDPSGGIYIIVSGMVRVSIIYDLNPCHAE